MKKKVVAMLLAGGQGSRLGILTSHMAKPAVPFGGKYRIIDFPLSNCSNSDIDTVGVLTQYLPLALNSYLGTGQSWDLNRLNGGVFVLPPYMSSQGSEWYSGTANAIYQNREFIDQYDPDYVLILSGDHIYKMDYGKMINFHVKQNAVATIAVLPVPMEEAHRFGIMNTDENDIIISFEEKPKEPKSNKASMGIYVFTWKKLREYLERDEADTTSANDFGKNIIPSMLNNGEKMVAYPFEGYWKDVGTIESLWEANMDLISDPPLLDLNDSSWKIYSRASGLLPHYVGQDAEIKNSLITEGAEVEGKVLHSVLFFGSKIGKGAVIEDSIIFPNAVIGENAHVKKAIIGENAVIGNGANIGAPLRNGEVVDNKLTGDITLIGNDIVVADDEYVPCGKVISSSSKQGE